MLTKTNVIELNGKRYDALTGRILHESSPHTHNQSIDGFVTVSPATGRVLPKNPKLITTPHSSTHTQPKAFDIHRAPQRIQAHHPQHASTLMRHAVKPPKDSLKRHAKAVTHTGVLAKKPLIEVLPKAFVSSVDEERLGRAKRIARSQFVSRFGNAHVRSAQKTTAVNIAQSPVAQKQAGNITKQASTDIFERAMAHANSHLQTPVQHKHPKHRTFGLQQFTSVAASSLAILFIVGFIAYQNAGAIQMHLAASRAGINATLPGWQPSGFAASDFKASPGTVTVGFLNSSTERSFSITQTVSNWNTTALFNDFVYPTSSAYDAIETAGTTIFTYGNNNATWVHNGIWYKLASHGSLSTSQIVDIAASM